MSQTKDPHTVKKRHRVRNWLIALACFIVLLIGARLALPIFLFNYFNKVLSEMKGYKGSIQGFDLALIKGGYYVTGFKLEKVEGKVPVPFIEIEKVTLHLYWEPIIKHFAFVAELELDKPKFNFVNGPTKATTQTGTEGDWTTPLKKLKAFTINKLKVDNGEVYYYDFHSKPQVKVFIKDLQLLVTNLKNVDDKGKKLPSHLHLTGNSIGNGKLYIDGDLNLLKAMPDFDAKLKFTEVDLKALADFTNAYAKFDFQKGLFSVYSQTALYNSHVKGYIRPLMEHVQVLKWNNETDEHGKKEGFFKKIWEGVVGTAIDVTKNQKHNRFATEIPFEGDIKDAKTEIFTAIINIFKNEFVRIFPKAFDTSASVNVSTILDAKKDDKAPKKK